MILEEAVEELTKILIKQDLKDKSEGKEYIKISKVDLMKIIIKLLKFLQKQNNG